MLTAFLFIFGIAIGSFLNVLASRYEEDGGILFTKNVTGRSHCTNCKKTLSWYELIPVLSYLVQLGKCRSCKSSLSFEYPAVEIVTGLLTAYLPLFLFKTLLGPQIIAQNESTLLLYLVIFLWMIACYTLITLSVIDLRLRIIPDQSNLLLFVISLVFIGVSLMKGPSILSLAGPYGAFLGAPESLILSSLIGGLFSLTLFGGIIFLTKERGMGMGDVKLAIPLGLLLGWPMILIATTSAFVIGSFVGVSMILVKKTTMKGALPFGPFLVLGFFIAIFYGEAFLRWYFSLV